MYVRITFGLNRLVAVSLSLSSSNFVSLDGMERCCLMQLINLGVHGYVTLVVPVQTGVRV